MTTLFIFKYLLFLIQTVFISVQEKEYSAIRSCMIFQKFQVHNIRMIQLNNPESLLSINTSTKIYDQIGLIKLV